MLNSLLKPIISLFPENNRLERIWKLAQVDFKKRYYNNKLGLLWALINPLTQIAIYYFVFNLLLPNQQENFALFLFSGLIFWIAFSQGTTLGSLVLIQKKYLIENIQFQWLDLYISHMLSVFMGLLFNIAAYLFLMIISGAGLGDYILYFPVVLLTWFLVTAAFSIIIGILRPIIEDVMHFWSLLLMIGFWVSGIFFTITNYIDNGFGWFLHVNPFIGMIQNVRACLLEGNELYFHLLLENLAFGIIVFLISIFLFNRYAHLSIEKQ